jgi:RNA 3'-phosphate cyclase
MIQLDGSHGEGGGSILRQAIALSIFTGKDFIIKDIRKNRTPAGLKAQHLGSLNAAAEMCKATYWGNTIGSTEVYFKPGTLKGSNFSFDIGTAGSATLFFQSILLPCVFSKRKVTINVAGGTDVSWSPPFDYFKSVFLPQLRRFCEVEAGVLRRGYYPKGGGELKVMVKSRLSKEDLMDQNPIRITKRDKLLQIKGVSHASTDLEKAQVSERQADAASLKLKSIGPVNIAREYTSSFSTGSGITLYAMYGTDEIDYYNPVILGGDSLGELGKKAEVVGLEAANRLLEEINSGAPVDEYLADQLIPYLALVGGEIITSKVTQHTLSNIYVCEKFLDVKFEVNDKVISCKKLV